MKTMEVTDRVRKIPRQARSRASVDFVLDAAAQVLEASGTAGFNTNAIADRAGISVGTLYRYFPNKASILQALARRETETHRQAIIEIATNGTAGLAQDRAMIRAFIQAFAGHAQARRIAMSAMLSEVDHGSIAREFADAETGLTDAWGRPLTRVQAFVLGRSIHGAMRAAVLEGVDFLTSQEFEDELVRLARAYLGYESKAIS